MAQTMWYILNTCFSTGALEFGNVLARGCSRDKDLKPKSPVVSQAVTACLWPHLAGGALCVTPLAGAGGNEPEEACTWSFPLLFPCDSPVSLSHSCDKPWPWIQVHTAAESSQQRAVWSTHHCIPRTLHSIWHFVNDLLPIFWKENENDLRGLGLRLPCGNSQRN